MPHPRETLESLGHAWPGAAKAVADYVPAVRVDGTVTVSGQVPLRDGALLAKGAVPDECGFTDVEACARQCVVNGLAAADAAVNGDWAGFRRVVRVGVFVASSPGFTDQHLVANAASGLLTAVFGDAGRHARAAVGVAALPLNAPVEVELALAFDVGPATP